MRARKTGTNIRQEQIAQAALDLIGRQGLAALSMADIAARVGLVPSALYRHFRSKEEVLDAVLDLYAQRLLGIAAAVREESPEALVRLRALLGRHLRLLAANRAIPHILFSDGIYAGSPARRARVHRMMSAYLRAVQHIIRDGQRAGTIRPDTPPRAAATLFLGLIVPAAVLWTVSGGKYDVAAHTEHVWPLFARALAATPCARRQPRRPAGR